MPTLPEITEAFTKIDDLLKTNHPGSVRLARSIAAGMAVDLRQEESDIDRMTRERKGGWHPGGCECVMCEYGRLGSGR